MITKFGRRIEFITEFAVSPETLSGVLTHLEKNIPFALVTEDGKDAIVYFPKQLMAKHSNGEMFSYNCQENFLDAVKMTFCAYPNFATGEKLIALTYDLPSHLLR